MSSKTGPSHGSGKTVKWIIATGASLGLACGLLWSRHAARAGRTRLTPPASAQLRSLASPLIPGSAEQVTAGPHHLFTGGGRSGFAGLDARKAARSEADASLMRLPIVFEPNEGQANPQVQFLARDGGLTMLLERRGAVIAVASPPAAAPRRVASAEGLRAFSKTAARRTAPQKPSAWRMELVGAQAAAAHGEQRLAGTTNYFIGNNPRAWRTNIPQFARVRYHSVYPGVDLVYYGNHGRLEYDFVVAPGGDLSAITLALTPASSRDNGGKTLEIAGNGDLVMRLADGEIRFHNPVVYQNVAADPAVGLKSAVEHRKYLEGRFILKAHDEAGFEVASYDRTRPLVVDPTLSYSTYLGGANNDFADDVVLDSAGNIYLVGTAFSANFPLQNAYQSTCASCPFSPDAFVTEMSADGSKLIFSTFLGGSSQNNATGVALDSSGNVYVTGLTYSSDFPTANAFQPNCASCTAEPDAFVAELPPGGASLTYSTYLGGEAADGAFGIAVDASGDAYIVGQTNSLHFPVQSPIQATLLGNTNAFIAEFKPLGAGLVYSTYLGSLSQDGSQTNGSAIAIDSKGNAYVTGQTNSNNFRTTTGAYQTSFGGNQNAYVTKVQPSGAGLAYSTYLGGTGQDDGRAIAVDSTGNAYVGGLTSSSNFPVLNAAQSTYGGGTDNGFITKLNAAGTALIYSTYLGGSGSDIIGSIALDKSNRAYVAGVTSSTNFPLVNALSGQTKYGGNQDAFVAKLSPGGCGLAFSTYLGGIAQDVANGIGVTSAGNPVVVGQTTSNNFPVTSNAFQGKTGGEQDAFVSILTGLTGPVDCITPVPVKFSPQVVTTTSSSQTVTLTNDGENPLTVSNIGTTAEFAQTNTCVGSGSSSGTVQPGANCTMAVTFTPVTAGVQTGALTVTDNGPNSPHTIPLSGTGQDFGFTANPPQVTITAGQQAQYTLTVSPVFGFNQTVALTCSGAPPDSTCTLNPKSVTLDGTSAQSVTVAVATTARTSSLFPYARFGVPPLFLQWKFDLAGLIFLALLLVLVGRAVRRRLPQAARHAFRIGVLMFALLALMVLFWSSCGGNGTLPTGTPAGNYGITVTGTDGTLTHSGQLGLKVN